MRAKASAAGRLLVKDRVDRLVSWIPLCKEIEPTCKVHSRSSGYRPERPVFGDKARRRPDGSWPARGFLAYSAKRRQKTTQPASVGGRLNSIEIGKEHANATGHQT
jgi:hypothetical protein